ncbi:MAG: hypothetical protein ABIR94_02995 [Rubrivivax sp.]
MFHTDPFGRLLVAQAMTEPLHRPPCFGKSALSEYLTSGQTRNFQQHWPFRVLDADLTIPI